MPHYLTNRGKLRLMQGKWDDTGGTTIKLGVLAGTSTPGALTESAIQDVNFISDLLALTGVDEPTDGSYARVTMTRSAATEDDTNNRVNMDASDVDFGALDNTDAYAVFWFIDGASDSAREVMGVDIFTPITLNGAGWTYQINDYVRAS